MAALPSEFELIGRYFAPLAREFPGAFGLTDDVAVMRPSLHHELVVKTDAVVGGIDFPVDSPGNLVARKALRVNLSDLAAKGAVPRAYTLDLLMPGGTQESWVAAFAAGLYADQIAYGVHLIGGDTGSTDGPPVVAVCAFGEIPRGRLIHRGGARLGDVVYVTGSVGDAALGLSVLRNGLTDIGGMEAHFLLERYRTPQPRVALGPQLIDIATASIDISDGLVADLRHVCACSGLSAVIDADSIPLSPAARVAVSGDGARFAAVLGGGDDYEILFTAHPGAAQRIAEISQAVDVAMTRIGHMTAPAGCPEVLVLDRAGNTLSIPREGWTHFGR